MSRLGNNPLFDADREREALGVSAPTKKGRPRKDLVRENGVQNGLPADWTRATFLIRCDQLQKLKDYAYTERITLKEALENALDEFLGDINDDDLLHKE